MQQKNPVHSVEYTGSVSLCELLTEAESLDDCTVAIDVAVVQIVKQCAALSYQLCQ